jgi:hypothetical protein
MSGFTRGTVEGDVHYQEASFWTNAKGQVMKRNFSDKRPYQIAEGPFTDSVRQAIVELWPDGYLAQRSRQPSDVRLHGRRSTPTENK